MLPVLVPAHVSGALTIVITLRYVFQTIHFKRCMDVTIHSLVADIASPGAYEPIPSGTTLEANSVKVRSCIAEWKVL